MRKQSSRQVNDLSTPVLLLQGQLWTLVDQRILQVGHVGRLLVHHRMIVPWLQSGTPRRQVLTSIKELQKFLHVNEAALVENAS